jgi:hypothetical protein
MDTRLIFTNEKQTNYIIWDADGRKHKRAWTTISGKVVNRRVIRLKLSKGVEYCRIKYKGKYIWVTKLTILED